MTKYLYVFFAVFSLVSGAVIQEAFAEPYVSQGAVLSGVVSRNRYAFSTGVCFTQMPEGWNNNAVPLRVENRSRNLMHVSVNGQPLMVFVPDPTSSTGFSDVTVGLTNGSYASVLPSGQTCYAVGSANSTEWTVIGTQINEIRDSHGVVQGFAPGKTNREVVKQTSLGGPILYISYNRYTTWE